jgi:predicted site-specific integrase-resolvase
MKLKQYAEENSICYRTAWNRYKKGKIPNAIKVCGNILIKIDEKEELNDKVVIYSRVSSSENKKNLLMQSERLQNYSIAKGYQIVEVIEEIGSGMNDNRKKLLKLLEKDNYSKIIIEHKDRLTRFGFNFLETLLKKEGKTIEVVNLAKDKETDLVQDMISVIYSFSAKLYGQRRSKNISKKITELIKEEKK